MKERKKEKNKKKQKSCPVVPIHDARKLKSDGH